MSTSVLFIHGRAQETGGSAEQDPARREAHVLAIKRNWLAGLAKGLVTAGLPVVPEDQVVFPFYADAFAEAIRDFEAHGGRRPDLELLAVGGNDEQAAIVQTKVSGVLGLAAELGYDPAAELGRSGLGRSGLSRSESGRSDVDLTDPELTLAAGELALEGIGDVLSVPVVRGALQFLSRKTGVPEWIIETLLEDVAYYLELSGMRDLVLRIVREELFRRQPDGGDVVVVGHSLGTIVAYDLLTRMPPAYPVRLLVTAGSPLGFPIVQKNLLGVAAGGGGAESGEAGPTPPVPAAVPARPGAWLNAYDVRDVVALIHPLSGRFVEAVPGQLVDERTHNPSGPHSISDYLSDPDVAEPIGRALRG